MTSKRADTVTPNGQEIRKLRLTKALTQQEFVKGCGITQRTLQRAEKGERIGSQFISTIAKRLEVPPEQIILSDKKQTEPQGDVIVRLQPVKGLQLIDWLQVPLGEDRLKYFFHVDPNSVVAGMIADVIEFCDECHIRPGKAFLGPTERIRAIGTLNDKLLELASQEVGVFASINFLWDVELRKSNTWRPFKSSRVLIAFGPLDAWFIDETEELGTQQSVFEHCARLNMVNGIDPDKLEDMDEPFVGTFHAFFREYWNARRATIPRLPKVISLVPNEGLEKKEGDEM